MSQNSTPNVPLILPPFEVSVRSSEHAVREALCGFLKALAPLDLDMEERTAVELVLAEALNNIVEHAYPTATPSGSIRIRGVHRGDGLHIKITDKGCVMPDGQAPLGQAQKIDMDLMDLPEGGFGWFLIRNLAKDVIYARVGEENWLELRMAVAVCRSN